VFKYASSLSLKLFTTIIDAKVLSWLTVWPVLFWFWLSIKTFHLTTESFTPCVNRSGWHGSSWSYGCLKASTSSLFQWKWSGEQCCPAFQLISIECLQRENIRLVRLDTSYRCCI
jgi:hypothetical protein